MTMKRTIRETSTGGSFTYGVVESYILGLATVRVAKGGARFTSIPVTFNMLAGSTVIIDHTNDVPSVRRDTILAYGASTRPLRNGHVFMRSSNKASAQVPEP